MLASQAAFDFGHSAVFKNRNGEAITFVPKGTSVSISEISG